MIKSYHWIRIDHYGKVDVSPTFNYGFHTDDMNNDGYGYASEEEAVKDFERIVEKYKFNVSELFLVTRYRTY